MSKFTQVLKAIEVARKKIHVVQQEQSEGQRDLLRKWHKVTRQRVSSYERGLA